MIDLGTRREIFGITVFQNADNPLAFYYLPGPPHISRENGAPLFDLFSYRKGGEADETASGGFLNMTVDVGIGGLKTQIENKLKEQHGDDVTLSSAPFSKGSVRVIALGEDSSALTGGVESETTASGGPLVSGGPRFIENILSYGRPSLDQDNRTIFSFTLSEDGAAFFLGVLSGSPNARPVGIVYDLEYVGLMPAYDLEITINFKSSYDYMRSRFTLGTLFFKADVDNILEELQRRESIKIKETARTLELSTPEAIRERQDHIDQLVKDLATGALFQPSLTPGEPKVKGETITAGDPETTSPAGTSQTSESLMTAAAHGPAAAVAAGSGAALNRADRAQAAANGGTAGETGGTGTSGTGTSGTGTSGTGTSGTTATQPTAADVWNKLGRPQAAYVLKSITQEEERTVTYNLSQISAQKKTVAPQSFVQFLAGPRELNERIHVIDLNHPFFQRLNINVNAADVDFDAQGIVQMTVQLRYGKRADGTRPKDTAEVVLRAPSDSRDFTFFMDEDLATEYEYKLIVDYKSDFGIGVDDTHIEGDWTPTEVRSLSVRPDWLSRVLPVSVQLAPNISDQVSEVHANVRYVNAERSIDDSQQVRLRPDDREETVHVRLADENEQFEVGTTLFYADGSQEALPPLKLPDPDSGSADDTVVISAPPGNFIAGDAIAVDTLAELSSVLVDLQVQQEGSIIDSRSLELSATKQRENFSVRLPRRDKPAVLRYRERRIFKDGGIETEEWQDAQSSNLIVGIPAEGVFPVTVRYLGGKPSELGLAAILLDLNYKAPNGDASFDQRESLLIDDGNAAQTQEWRIKLADRDVHNYEWRMTLIKTDGTQVATPSQTDNRDLLVLFPPG
jgi:hypothetical protein